MPKPPLTFGPARLAAGPVERRNRPKPRLVALAAALMLSAVPLPSFAEAGAGQNIAIALSSSLVSSPVGTGDAARVVPGAVVDFSVSVTGPGESDSATPSFAITDRIPEQLSLFVGDLAHPGTGPAAFIDHDSGLEFTFDGLASAEDSIEFSSNGGRTYDYVPVADASGFDRNVTHLKLRPRGVLLPTSNRYERFSIRYRMKVK